jgi:hypothetical protein
MPGSSNARWWLHSEFFSDYTYSVDTPQLEIPVGQLPVPNLRLGQALTGDCGV